MRGSLALLTTAATVAALCAAAHPALAAPRAPAAGGAAQTPVQLAAQARVIHPQDDYAGAQIARYEGPRKAADGARSQSGRVSPQDTQAAQDTPGTPADPPVSPAGPPMGPTGPAVPPPEQLAGLDVSSHQPNVTWPGVVSGGARFVYAKATEGVNYLNPAFAGQYGGAYSAGLIRGAYHFATPNTSDPVAQADYFLAHGGAWSNDGHTLPPAVDLEYNPYGDACYGMTPQALSGWIHGFADRIHQRTGRFPMIYTSVTWWTRCTGNDAGFGSSCPLWIARYAPAIGPLPAGWQTQAIWQYADSGPLPGDQDSFAGSVAQLRQLAVG